MKKRKILMLILSTLVLVNLWQVRPYAQNVPIVQDNGTGNQYDTLPINYVQIKNLKFDNALIESGQGYSLAKGYVGQADYYRTNLIWTGKFKFGTGNTTNDANAKLQQNTLPDVTVRFPDGAKLSDGTDCDVLMTLSEVKVNLGTSRISEINNNTQLQIVIAGGWGMLGSMPPRTTYAKQNGSAANKINSGASIGSKYKVTIKVVNKGTTTPVSSDYPTMLVEFKDLDICDRTIRKSASAAARGNGTYAEGIELVSGWVGSAVLAPTSNDLANTLLINTQTVNNNTRIKVDGDKITSFEDKFKPSDCDYNTLWSGFVAAVQPQGFSFYWTGSHAGSYDEHDGMGTTIGGQPTVAVKARRINPGASGAVLGDNGVKSGVDKWETNTHLMNSSYGYNYKPAEGWYMKSLRVDGVEQTLTDDQRINGGTYTFERLNKYPLPKRDVRTGQILQAQDSGFYTIEAEYEQQPDYTLQKTSGTQFLDVYDESVINYEIRVDELNPGAPAGTYEIHDDMANGLLMLEGEPEVTVSGGTYTKVKADDTGLVYKFNSEAANGGAPSMVIKYKARVNWDAYKASGKTSVVNTCNGSSTETEILSSLRITKNVRGNLGDLTKEFSFTVDFSGLEPNMTYGAANNGAVLVEGFRKPEIIIQAPRPSAKAIKSEDRFADSGTEDDTGIYNFRADAEGKASLRFRLKDEKGILFDKLPAGAAFTISEEESDHFPEYHITGQSGTVIKEDSHRTHSALSTGEFTMETADTYNAAFINSRDIAPITGIPGDAAPIAAATAAAGCVAVASSILYALCKRKRVQ